MELIDIEPGGRRALQAAEGPRLVHVIAGRGTCSLISTVEAAGSAGSGHGRIDFEWKSGALLAIPPSWSTLFFNGSGKQPARLAQTTIAGTTSTSLAPIVVADLVDMPMIESPAFGDRVGSIALPLAGAIGAASRVRILELPPGAETAFLAQGSDTVAWLVTGRGYTELWLDNQTHLPDRGRGGGRVEWSAEASIDIPAASRHRHVNTGPTPARLLTLS